MDDLISRQDAYKCLEIHGDYDTLNEVYERLEKLPPAKPQEPKTGQWILTDDDFVYCSECEDSYYPRPIDASWYYCPHCGARMVESQESEETNADSD